MVRMDKMMSLTRTEKLMHEADMIMGMIRLDEILEPYGRWVLTGSYYLNVMVYPDLDIYITKVSLTQLFEIAAQIASCELVSQVVYEPSDDPEHMPGGLYLKTRLKYGDWGRPWKIDLWSLPEDVIRRKTAEMSHFLQKMTPHLREEIIRYKLSVMTAQKRTPVYSGYYIYKAFIDEGLADFENVTRYLISCGVQM